MITAEAITHFATLSLPVESELGRCSLPVREFLSLAPGSVIKLSRSVGSPVDLYVGGTLFSSGQIVKTGDSMGVRLVFEKRPRV